MLGVFLPGARRVELRQVPEPVPGHGELVLAVRASTICGSDLRAIYREHTGTGPEAYAGVVAGHEPAGEVVATGPGCRRFRPGDRVLVYHIRGCGMCEECRLGWQVGCTSPERAAYGWQRDGGHAELLLADEASCIALPGRLSYLDGACVACSFGTAYEALRKADAGGADAVLVVGLGPVGLAVAMLARALGGRPVVGVDAALSRVRLAERLGVVDAALEAGDPEAVREQTGGRGFEVTVDASGSAQGRATAVSLTRRHGRCVLVGEGGRLDLEASPLVIHPQVTVMGSWVTSLWRMEELVERLDRWDLHPEDVVTHRFPLQHADEAYRVADGGEAGKVALVPS
jgi:2-desacetyl-2-hydroxyethyl bacteriochlorophyllide A dehydrogenase